MIEDYPENTLSVILKDESGGVWKSGAERSIIFFVVLVANGNGGMLRKNVGNVLTL
jgi:hypothetical protein